MKQMPNPKDGAVKRLVDAQIQKLEGELRESVIHRDSLKRDLVGAEEAIAETEKTLAELRAYKPEA